MPSTPDRATRIITLFFTGCVLFLPVPFHLFSGQEAVSTFLFGPLVRATAAWLNQPLKGPLFLSDSLSLFLLAGWLLLIAWLLDILFSVVRPRFLGGTRWQQAGETLLLYYLVAVLLRYGADKVFMAQFPRPEPNILFTPAGRLDKDIFFWSAMGSSRLYNLLSGGAECLAALLLFFRRTRRAGLLFSFLLLVHILVLNLSFDISVKLFSFLLSGISLFLLWRQEGLLLRFLQRLPIPESGPPRIMPLLSGFPYYFLKMLLAGCLLLEGFYFYARTGRWNDEKVPLPFLHGAYEVQRVIQGNDTLYPPDLPVRRLFIHRQSYLILQDPRDGFRDYALAIDSLGSYFRLTDYGGRVQLVPYEWRRTDSLLVLHWRTGMSEQVLEARTLPWSELPLLQDGFHGFSDR